MRRRFLPNCPVFIRAVTFSIVFSAVIFQTSVSVAKVYSTKTEALESAFPDAVKVERKNIFLTPDDIERIEESSKTKVESKLFTYYRAVDEEGTMGYAVIQSHVVRTKSVVYMAIIGTDGEVDRIDVLAFYEPEEYLPSKRWLAQFIGKKLSERLWIHRDIQAISGATISTYTMIREIRKALAIIEIKVLGVDK